MIKIANAPCSWGVLEFDLAGKAAGFEQVEINTWWKWFDLVWARKPGE